MCDAANRLAALDARIAASRQMLAPHNPPPLIRPYIPETVVTMMDGQRHIVTCDSLMACAEYAEFILQNGFRLAKAGELFVFPPHQVKQIRVRKRERAK